MPWRSTGVRACPIIVAMAYPSKMLKRFALIIIGLFGLGWLGMGAFALSFVISDMRIALTWPSEGATIQSVGEPQSGRRGGPFFPVLLHVRRMDGTVVVGWPERNVYMPTQEHFLGLRRAPQIGDRVVVHVSVEASPRIVPAERLRGLVDAVLIVIFCGFLPILLLMSLPQTWRLVSEATPPPPDGPDSPPTQAEARRRKAARRRRR